VAIDKNKIIEAATKYVQKGQYDKAIKEYAKLLEIDPKDARIQQKLGELYQKKGENNLAADCFLKVAESYSADGFFLKAVAVYKQVLKLNPNLVEVNLRLAELHQQLGLMSDAMAQYQLVVNHYDKVGNAKASLDTLRKMVDLDPDNIASRIKLAELYARESMNADAIAEFQRAAEYLKRNNRVDDYLKVAERLVFLDPGNIELTRELAAIYLAKQDTKRALAKLQLCFKADPRDVETLSMLAQAFKELGQLSKTVSVYKELAKIYDEQDQVDQEREIWKKIYEIAPEDPDAKSRMAPRAAPEPQVQVAPIQVGPPSARPSPAPVQPVSPEQITKLLTETDVYVKYGLHEKAIEHLKKVFAADPECLDGHEKAATLFSATGNRAAAIDSLARAVRIAIQKSDARARALLQRLCEQEPTHPEIPGFLSAVGGLAPVEEVAEIEDDAILVDTNDEEVQVAEEPPPHDLALDAAVRTVEEDAVDESLVEPPAEDEALAVAEESSYSEAVEDSELIAAPVEDEELIAAPVEDEDELAISAASGLDESFQGEMPYESEELEPAPQAFGEGEVEVTAPGGPIAQFDAEELDPHEEATRVAFLPSLLGTGADQTVNEPLADEPFADEPLADEPLVDEPLADEPLADEPLADEPLADEPVAELPPDEAVADSGQEVGGEEAVEGDEDPAGDELDEAEFFVDQGELEEAREILETVLLAFPRSRRAAALMAKLEAKETGGDAPPEAASNDAAFDLASELADDDFGDLGGSQDPAPEDFQYSVEDVFNEFKKGVEKIVNPGDVDTHYDLGIAYKEMGLVEDAIHEFEQACSAAAGKKKEIESLTMVGLCRAERGEYAAAVKAFERGLACSQITPEMAKALHYELGLAHEQLDDKPHALAHFMRVEKADPKFREVGEAVKRLRALGIEAASDEDQTDPGKPPTNGAAHKRAAAPEVSKESAASRAGDAQAKKNRKVGFV